MYNKYSYLYVDDDPLSREIMQVAMENLMGVERLSLFSDSSDFMARLKALPQCPDLILLDIHMKPHTGFELLNMIRQDSAYQHVLVIALTASVMNAEFEKLRHSGFDGAIGKPLNVLHLPELIKRIFNGQPVWLVSGVD